MFEMFDLSAMKVSGKRRDEVLSASMRDTRRAGDRVRNLLRAAVLLVAETLAGILL